jgi:hypothetical protein
MTRSEKSGKNKVEGLEKDEEKFFSPRYLV